MKTLILLFFLAVVYGCKENKTSDRSSNVNPTTDTAKLHSSDNTDSTISDLRLTMQDTGLYSVQLPGATIALRQWDSTINLEQQLGIPSKQKIRKLDLNADTHAGSFIKDMEFEGLKLKLFSPPQNGKHFWIQEIILTGKKYRTTRGITIGDPFETVKQAYPTLKKFPGVNENMYYVSDDGYEKSMEMEFEKKSLKKLRFYYMIP